MPTSFLGEIDNKTSLQFSTFELKLYTAEPAKRKTNKHRVEIANMYLNTDQVTLMIYDSDYKKKIRLFLSNREENLDNVLIKEVCQTLEEDSNDGVNTSVELSHIDNTSLIVISYTIKKVVKKSLSNFLDVAILFVIKNLLKNVGFYLTSTHYVFRQYYTSYSFNLIECVLEKPIATQAKLCFFLCCENTNKSFWLVLKQEEKIVQELIDTITNTLTKSSYICQAKIMNEDADFNVRPRELYFSVKKASSFAKGDRFQDIYLSLTLTVLSKYGYWMTCENRTSDNRVGMLAYTRRICFTELPPLITEPLPKGDTLTCKCSYKGKSLDLRIRYLISAPDKQLKIQNLVFAELSSAALTKKLTLTKRIVDKKDISYGNGMIYTISGTNVNKSFDFILPITKVLHNLNFFYVRSTIKKDMIFMERPDICHLVLLKQVTPLKFVTYTTLLGRSRFTIFTYGIDCKSELLKSVTSFNNATVTFNSKNLVTGMSQHIIFMKWQNKVLDSWVYNFLILNCLHKILKNHGLFPVVNALQNYDLNVSFQPLGSVLASTKQDEEILLNPASGLCVARCWSSHPKFSIYFCVENKYIEQLVEEVLLQFTNKLSEGNYKIIVARRIEVVDGLLVNFKFKKDKKSTGQGYVSYEGRKALLKQTFAKFDLIPIAEKINAGLEYCIFTSRNLIAEVLEVK